MDALNYDKNQHYTTDQIKKIQRAVDVDQDGKWGPHTVSAVRIWQGHHGLTPDGKVGPATYAAIVASLPGGGGGNKPPPSPTNIRTVGVWTGHTSFGAKAPLDVQFCSEHNINRLDVVINDFSKDRTETPFNTFDRAQIVDLCARARDAGIEVNLMSWIMPHTSFIEEAAASLIPLCETVGAASLMWDAEEPWNRAHRHLPYEDAAAQVASSFATLGCPMGVTGIMSTSVDKIGPLARVCAYMTPQCYATHHNELDPMTIVSRGLGRWREKFGHDKRAEVGLAAYRQGVVDGHDTHDAMLGSLQDASANEVDTVVYWSLAHIKRTPSIASVISGILKSGC